MVLCFGRFLKRTVGYRRHPRSRVFRFRQLPFLQVSKVLLVLGMGAPGSGKVVKRVQVEETSYTVVCDHSSGFHFCYGHVRTSSNHSMQITSQSMAANIFTLFMSLLLLISLVRNAMAYDPNDKSLKDILLPEGQFEAFYLKGSQEEEQNAVRPPHLHGSFHQYKNPALVGAPNSAAYGFRFDGKRRFNYN